MSAASNVQPGFGYGGGVSRRHYPMAVFASACSRRGLAPPSVELPIRGGLRALCAVLALWAFAADAQDDYWKLPVPAQGKPPESHHPLTRNLEADNCGLCHQAKLRQWRDSLHARAMSKGVAGQLNFTSRSNVEACLACHTPRSEQWALWDKEGASALTKLRGVDCAACHVRNYKRFGPRDVKETPHGAVKALPLFKDSKFCAKCHQFPPGEGTVLNGKPLENTYNEWLASPYSKSGRTCQSCHMPDGKHEFKGIHDPEMTRRGLAVRVMRTAQGMHVRATNAGAGHALPTYGTPRITIRSETVVAGEPRRSDFIIQRRVDWNPKTGWRELSDTRLLPGQSLNLNLPLAKDKGASVRVFVQPDQDYHDRVYPMLLSAPINLSKEDRAMLEAARDAGIRSEYTLYSFECGPWPGSDKACRDSTKAAANTQLTAKKKQPQPVSPSSK